jgi:integrase
MIKTKRRYRQRGSGSIIELGDLRYRIGYDTSCGRHGRTQRFEVVRGTKREAEDLLRSRIDEVRKGEAGSDNPRCTFEQLSIRFLAAKKLSKEATTHRLYERTLKQHVLPVIGHMKARDVKPQHVAHILESATNKSRTTANGKPLGGTSLRNVRTLVKAVLGYGVKQGVLHRNVGDLVEPPALPHTERSFIEIEDLNRLLECAEGTEISTVIVLALCTGLRRQEICGLKWADFDPVTGHIMVKRAAKVVDGQVVIGNVKSSRSARTEVVDDHMVELLRRQRLSQLERRLSLGLGNPGQDGFIFERPDGLPCNPNDMSRAFSRLVRRHRLPAMRLHDLRHSNASLRHASGSSLKDISSGLGHSNINITANLYVHLFAGATREQAERLSGYLGKVLPAIRHGSGA